MSAPQLSTSLADRIEKKTWNGAPGSNGGFLKSSAKNLEPARARRSGPPFIWREKAGRRAPLHFIESNMPNPDLSLHMLSMPEVVALTGVSSHTIRRLITRGTFPAPVMLSAQPRWAVTTIRAWAEGRWSPAPSPSSANASGFASNETA